MVLTTMVVADNGTPPAQPDDSNGGFFVNLNVSLGLLGAGLFSHRTMREITLFVPSVGPMLRMAYPLLVGNSATTGRRSFFAGSLKYRWVGPVKYEPIFVDIIKGKA